VPYILSGLTGLFGGTSGGSQQVGGSTGPLGAITNGLLNIGSSLGLSGNPAGGAGIGGQAPAGMASAGAAMPQSTPWGQLSQGQQGTVNQALAANPATAGLIGNVAAVDPLSDGTQAATSAAAPASNAGAWAGFGDVAAGYANYLTQMQRELLSQRTAYAPTHSTPGQALPNLNLYPAAQFALPQL
jgi:hypothetical protein